MAVGPEVTKVAPVRHAFVTLRLPAPVPLDRVVIGQNDALGDPRAHTRDGQVWFWQADDLDRGARLEIRLQFPPLVPAIKPQWQERDDQRRRAEKAAAKRRELLNALFFGIGLLGLAAGGIMLYGLWYLRGRDPHTGLVAAFLPAPPDDLPPGAAGALVDEIVNEQDIVATLVDLARRGVIAMQTTGIGIGRDVKLTLLAEPDHLSLFERGVLEAIFGSTLERGQRQSLFSAQDAVAQAGPRLRELLDQELVARGYFTASPHLTREVWRTRALRGLVLTVVIGLALYVAAFRGVGWYWFAVAIMSLVWLVLFLVSGAMPRKTRAGAEAAARWRAFRRYLSDIERYDRLEEARDRFERYLPYAIAFGLAQDWIAKFAAAGASAPSWYQTPESDSAPLERKATPADRQSDRPRSRSWWDVLGAAPDQQRAERVQ